MIEHTGKESPLFQMAEDNCTRTSGIIHRGTACLHLLVVTCQHSWSFLSVIIPEHHLDSSTKEDMDSLRQMIEHLEGTPSTCVFQITLTPSTVGKMHT